MQVDHRTVASDGYMMNMQGILLRLFEPVMDVTYSKVCNVFLFLWIHLNTDVLFLMSEDRPNRF
jgi:ubiquitin conjugation factor E4 B